MEEREGTVSKLHGDSRESFLGLGDIDEVQDDGLVVSEHITVCDSEEKRVADLSCCSGDGHSHGLFDFGLCGGKGTKVLKRERVRWFISTLIIISLCHTCIIQNSGYIFNMLMFGCFCVDSG